MYNLPHGFYSLVEGDDETIAALVNRGVVLSGHRQLSGGGCTDIYLEMANLSNDGHEIPVVRNLAYLLLRHNPEIRTLVGPETLGAVIAKQAAELMCEISGRSVISVAALHKDQGGKLILASELLKIVPPIAIVDDVTTTLNTNRTVEQALGSLRGGVVAYACVVDRRPPGVETDQPTISLVRANFPYWPPGKCPKHGDQLCLATAPADP
ncbi:MAG: hypothetical protein AAB774_01705 [Patescibacteria group bacterium]